MATITKDKPATAFDPNAKITSGRALERWRRKIKISRPIYAVLCGCSERTLATFEAKTRISLSKERRLNEARRLIAGLCQIMEPENISHWLKEPNDWLEGMTPLGVMQAGKADKIWEMIYHTREGGYL